MADTIPPTARDSTTWVAEASPHWNRADRKACLVHIYPHGPNLGQRFYLSDDPILIGRDDDCHVRIDDHTVSRWHARVVLGTSGFRVLDLNSTNGTHVNQVRIGNALLVDGDYLQIGNCIYRFLAGGNVETSYHEEIYRCTIIDGLTGLHNRRYFFEFLERELIRSSRHHRPLSLILFDIDHFHEINGSMGHLGGDYTLRELARILKGETRADELLARYGGEEFTVTLPETERAGAFATAERIRGLVEQHEFRYEDTSYSVTISLGVASTDGSMPTSCEQLIQEADRYLDQAKRQGRNLALCE